MALGNYLTFAVFSIFCAVVFMLDPPATTPGQPTTQTNCSKPCFANKTCDANCTCYSTTHGRFVGENCTDYDECRHRYNHLDVCHNRGHCKNTWGSYKCTCLAGWSGSHCTEPNGTKGECLPGYTGKDCRTLAACVHGNGRNISGNLSCSCHDGWTQTGGNRSSQPCTTDIDECRSPEKYCINGKCTNFNGSYKCDCKIPFFGSTCNYFNACVNATSNPCQNGGKCLPKDTTKHDYDCKCANGWDGKNCTYYNICKATPSKKLCLNGGSCIPLNTTKLDYRCDCQFGWGGKNCSEKTTDTTASATTLSSTTPTPTDTTIVSSSLTPAALTSSLLSATTLLSTISKSTSTAGGSGTNLPVVVGASVGGVTLTGFVTVSLVCIYRKSKHRKVAPKEANTEQVQAENSGGTTIVISETYKMSVSETSPKSSTIAEN